MAELGENFLQGLCKDDKDFKVEASMLDYDYIAKLRQSNKHDRDILSAIVKALEERTHEFGSYPHLLETAKQKLFTMLDEKSQKIITAMRMKPSSAEIQREKDALDDWLSENQSEQQAGTLLSSEKVQADAVPTFPLPSVRGDDTQNKNNVFIGNTLSDSIPSKLRGDKKDILIRKENMSNRDYFQAWDKFDAEAAFDVEDTKKSNKSISNTSTALKDKKQHKAEKALIGQAKNLRDLQAELGVKYLSISELSYSAQKAKNQGNEYFRCSEFEKAVIFYSKSIAYDEKDAIVYANRALASIRLKNFESALSDCSKSLTLDPSYLKARCRRGIIHHTCGRYDDAMVDFQTCLDDEPKNKEFLNWYKKSQQKRVEVSGGEGNSKQSEIGRSSFKKTKKKILIEEVNESCNCDEANIEIIKTPGILKSEAYYPSLSVEMERSSDTYEPKTSSKMKISSGRNSKIIPIVEDSDDESES